MKSIKELFNNTAFALIVTLVWCIAVAWAADTKLSALTNMGSAPAGTDELYIVDDPGGTPNSEAITVANLFAYQGDFTGTFDGQEGSYYLDATNHTIVAGDLPDLSGTYEVQLDNEAGLYAVLSDVSQFYEAGDENTIAAAITTGIDGTAISSGEIADARIPNDIIIDAATLASTVTLTDNEATNENNPIWFSAGAAGSGSIAPEADGGDFYYNPGENGGTLHVPNVDMGGSPTPGIYIKDTDNAAGTGFIYANSSGGANDIILSIGVEESSGESTEYIQIDGVAEDVEIKKSLVVEANATFSGVLTNTPQAKTYNASDDAETIGTDLTSSIIFITTDNDSTDEEVDIQDGTADGQMITFVCVSGCDGTDDGVDIDVEEDSTCTGCQDSGVFSLGTNGDSLTIVWDGTASAWYQVGFYQQ